jgi:hypothetical protein
MQDYFTGVMAKERLAELRALAERSALVRDAAPARGALRMALGAALVRWGQRLIGETATLAAGRRPA